MSIKEIDMAVKNLRDEVQIYEHNHCVAVTIRITSQGYSYKRELRSPGGLERDKISMRNLRGEFIE